MKLLKWLFGSKKPILNKPVVSSRFIGGFQDTRTNKENFALTPFLFGIWATGEIIKVRGIGICWGYYSIYLGLGWNIPKNYPSFKVESKNDN
jgi:hypothetical protein